MWLQVSKEVPFAFSMDSLEAEFGDLSGKEIFVKCWYYDWFLVETQNGTAVTKVIEDGIRVKRVGNRFRTFKPGVTISVHVSTSIVLRF